MDVQTPTTCSTSTCAASQTLWMCSPSGEPITAAHLGAGALTLVRYIQATRPGSRQIAVDIEPELMGFVTDRLPLPAGPTASWWSDDAREQLAKPARTAGRARLRHDHSRHLHRHGCARPPDEPRLYRELKDALSERGMVAINVGDDAVCPSSSCRQPPCWKSSTTCGACAKVP